MNVRQLEAFQATMDTGSVSRAAQRLGVSQPAVSKLLKSLSESCGFPLFTRKGGQFVPTQEARTLSAEVDRMFSGTERVARLAAALRNREWGEVSVAAPAALATRYLGHVLAPFLAAQPDLHFTLKSRPSPQIAELVAAQQVDIGMSVLPCDHPRVDSERMMQFDMICIMPAHHPLAVQDTVTLADLRNEPFISLARDDCSLMTIDRAFQVQGVQKRTAIEVPLSETICGFVANGIGVSVVPPFVGLDYDESRLARRKLLPSTPMNVWLLTPNSRPRSLAAQRLAEIIKSAVHPHGMDSFTERGRPGS